MDNKDLPFLIGSLVCLKESGQFAIVVGDYAFLCDGDSDDTELSLALLDFNKEKIVNVVSWFDLSQVELIKISLSDHYDNLLMLYNYYHSR